MSNINPFYFLKCNILRKVNNSAVNDIVEKSLIASGHRVIPDNSFQILVPFNFGLTSNTKDKNKMLTMLNRSLDCYLSLTSEFKDSFVTVSVTSELYNEVRRLIPSEVKMIIVTKSYLDSRLWNSFKFVSCGLLNHNGPILIGDYDIVFSRKYEYFLKDTILDLLTQFSLDQEHTVAYHRSELGYNELNPVNGIFPYSHFKSSFHNVVSRTSPSNAGLIFSTHSKLLFDAFFDVSIMFYNKFGDKALSNKRLFAEGAIEQMIMPEVFHNMCKFTLLDNDRIEDPYPLEDEQCHLFGSNKNSTKHFKHFLRISRERF
jgi:hypothetical protein